jgi:uncharacterized protein YndB with AHSA1/START domain
MEVVYPHTPERVWRALTDRRALAHWLMPNDFEPRLGHRFQFRPRKRQDGPGPVQCEVTALEAPRRLAYTWHAPGDSTPSEVTWTLEPVERGTRLRLEHTAADATADAVADALAADATADAATEALWTHRTFTLCALLSVGAPTAVTIRPRRTRRRVGLVMAIASGSAASMRSRS